MVTLTNSQIVESVRYRIDEIGANESDMIDADKDDTALDDIIKAVAGDAYRLVMLGADASMLEGSPYTEASMTFDDDLMVSITLPSDFLRLVSVRLSSWKSSASEVIQESSVEYRQQSDKEAGATYLRPVAAIVYNDSGKMALELYRASAKTDTLRHFIYVKTPADGATSYSVPAQLKQAVIWYAAALTLTAVKDSHAEQCLSVAKGLMGGTE